jgi:enoyl-CoA hydratase/carnithine racemase
LNSTTVVELAALVERIEQQADLNVVVFTSEDSDFFMARYYLSDNSPVAFAPTGSGVTLFIDSMRRMYEAAPIIIASVRGRARGGGNDLVSRVTSASPARRRCSDIDVRFRIVVGDQVARLRANH